MAKRFDNLIAIVRLSDVEGVYGVGTAEQVFQLLKLTKYGRYSAGISETCRLLNDSHYISVLQGSILGPILFLVMINDLPNSSNLHTSIFADDTQGA